MDIQAAKELVEKEKLERAEKCGAEIKEVLAKYNCTFLPQINVVSK